MTLLTYGGRFPPPHLEFTRCSGLDPLKRRCAPWVTEARRATWNCWKRLERRKPWNDWKRLEPTVWTER